ncbi:MAG: hypothetical protein JWO78_1714 [Micavibrio sp.]|nr:hypothetical protein [Micavibrio sp.]
MPLTYEQDSQLNALSPVLDEHAEWFSRVIRHVFYPEKKMENDLLAIPDSFENWANVVSQIEGIQKESLDRVRRVHADMHEAAQNLIENPAHDAEKPAVKKFDTFVTFYDEFVSNIRRLERDAAVSDSGLDPLTALRTRHVMAKDLEREMERRARRGRPFCLALAKIDHYDEIRGLPQEVHDKAMQDVSEIIRLTIRSFDDAYRLPDGEFIMCLKQTEMSGGAAGLNRLRKLLEERAPSYMINGEEKRISLSACVAEPQPGDTIDVLIENMRGDMNRYSGEEETVLEYFEQSPLQRFVIDQGQKN